MVKFHSRVRLMAATKYIYPFVLALGSQVGLMRASRALVRWRLITMVIMKLIHTLIDVYPD